MYGNLFGAYCNYAPLSGMWFIFSEQVNNSYSSFSSTVTGLFAFTLICAQFTVPINAITSFNEYCATVPQKEYIHSTFARLV